MADLKDKTVIVTGAGSGIGKATAVLAAAGGATVIVADVKGAEKTAKEIGAEAQAFTLDITDAARWKEVVDEVICTHDRIDGLANVAGITTDTDSLLTQTEEGWQRILDVDLKGTFLGMQAVAGQMIEHGGGSIVNVASTAGLTGMPGLLAYSTAKGGVIAMSRQVAIEYAKSGLRVNVVAPGLTRTPILSDSPQHVIDELSSATPTGELATAEQQGQMIVYLLGSGSDQLTGQVIPIDGGWTAQ